MYHMNRLLDSVFMGDYSVNTISEKRLYNYSLRDVVRKVNSSLLTNRYKGSLDDAAISRTASNIKEAMMKSRELEENCE